MSTLGTTPSSHTDGGVQTYLNEGESSSRFQRLVFMFHLMGHVVFHPFFLIDLPLCHHVEESARGDRDGDGILGFWLWLDGKVI